MEAGAGVSGQAEQDRQEERPEQDDGQRDEVFGVEKRKAIIGVVIALGLSVGATAVIGQVTSYHKLLNALQHAQKWWLPLCLLGLAVAYSGYIVAYRSVARADGGPQFDYWIAGRVVALGRGAYVLGSAAGGLGTDFWAMRRAGAETHEAARRTLALNTLHAAGLAVFAVGAGGYVLLVGPTDHTSKLMAIVWVCAAPAAVIGARIVSDERLAPRLLQAPDDEERPSSVDVRAWAHWLANKLRKGFADAVGGVVYVRDVLHHPVRYLGGLMGFPLYWLGDFFILWVALHAFGSHLSPARLIVAEASAWALSFLPLPAGGSGVAETVVAFTLHAVGVPLSISLFAALTYRGINFWLPLLPALALLPRVPQLQEDLTHVERAERDEDAPIHADLGSDGGGESES